MYKINKPKVIMRVCILMKMLNNKFNKKQKKNKKNNKKKNKKSRNEDDFSLEIDEDVENIIN